MRNLICARGLRQQDGVVLIVSLILLVLMTLIGVAAMQTTTLEEKMTGNMRDYDLAFQSAETALREGESRLRTPPPRPSIQDTNSPFWVWNLNRPHPNAGLSDFNPDETSAWWATRKPWWGYSQRDSVWWKDPSQSHSCGITGLLMGVNAPPRYLIEHQAYLRYHIGVNDYSDLPVGRDYYRVTARAEGGESATVVLLQSIFSWPYD